MPDNSTRHENTSKFTPLCVTLGCLLMCDEDNHALLIERRRQPWEARKQLLCLKGLGQSYGWLLLPRSPRGVKYCLIPHCGRICTVSLAHHDNLNECNSMNQTYASAAHAHAHACIN